MKKNLAILLAIIIMVPLVLTGLFFLQTKTGTVISVITRPPAMVGGGQAGVEITAKEGYKPAKWLMKANQPAVIKIITKDTVDCSSTVVIPDINYHVHLPPT